MNHRELVSKAREVLVKTTQIQLGIHVGAGRSSRVQIIKMFDVDMEPSQIVRAVNSFEKNEKELEFLRNYHQALINELRKVQEALKATEWEDLIDDTLIGQTPSEKGA